LSPNFQSSSSVPTAQTLAVWQFSFLAVLAALRHCRQIGLWALYRLRAHTGAGGQCADATETGIGADGPTRIHTGTGNGDLGEGKASTGLPMYCPTGQAEWLVSSNADCKRLLQSVQGRTMYFAMTLTMTRNMES